MKILITGGAGFIGSHVAECLLNQGHEITIIDDLSTGRVENLANIKTRVHFVKGSILDKGLFDGRFNGIDAVVHLAAQISVTRSLKDPYTDGEINILGSINLAEFCLDRKIKRLVFTSSGGAVYGDPDELPATEATSPSPLSPYAASKLSFENYLNYYREKGLDSMVLRLGNIYGPRQDPRGEAGVISIFLDNLRRGKPFTLFGDGSSSRDYLNVLDLVQLVSLVIDSPITGCFNVSSGKETKLKELVSIMKRVTGIDPEINYLPLRKGEVKNTFLSNRKIVETTGWKPLIDLNAGIKSVWHWLNEQKE